MKAMYECGWLLVVIVAFGATNTAGAQIGLSWIAHFGLTGTAEDQGLFVCVDSSHNVLVTGVVWNLEGERDCAILKYDSEGTLLWDAFYNGSGEGEDIPEDVCLDASGNLYVVISSEGVGSDYDCVTVKYGTDGSLLWEHRYNGSDNLADGGEAVALSNDGSAYVVGFTRGASTGLDYLTIKLDSSGTEQWSRIAFLTEDAMPASLALGASGDIVVTGFDNAYGSVYALLNFATVKYDPDGNHVWTQSYNGPVSGSDHARSAVIDSFGNVYIAGTSSSSTTGSDIVLIQYDGNGVLQWENRSEVAGTDYTMDMRRDATGNCYVAGTGYNNDYRLLKINSSGSLVWDRRYSASIDGLTAMTLDPDGNAYVTGYTLGAGGTSDPDIVTICYSIDGDTLWQHRYTTDGDRSFDFPSALAVDSGGGLILVGFTGDDYGSTMWLTLKYAPCECFCHSDPQCDSVMNVVDVISTIDVAFRAAPAIPDPNTHCPLDATDVDCNGITGIIDVVKVVNVAFRGANSMTEFCNPCP